MLSTMPITCSLVGLSLRKTALNISTNMGITAIIVPLSLAVVSRMPTLSPIKYITGWNMAIVSTVPKRLPRKLSFIAPQSASMLITTSAVTKRQLKSVNADTRSTAPFVKRKLKPNSRLATSVAIMPSVSFFEPILFPMPYSIT